MMRETVKVVLRNLNCNWGGLNALGAFATAVGQHRNKLIVVDCEWVTWIDANIAAALGAIHAKAEAFESKLEYRRLKPKIEEILHSNGLFSGRLAIPRSTCIPLRHYGLDQGKLFAEYTTKDFAGQDMPLMSNGLRQKFFEGLDELFNNASIHSKSPCGVFACGQAYPKKQLLDFTIVDMGIGFRVGVEAFLGRRIAASDAIEWAMAENNTTRIGDVPGGLGLPILKAFVEANGGRLTVFSQEGYWNLSSNGVNMSNLRNPFPGVLVNLEISTGDENEYYLEGEFDPNAAL